jgi:cytochrome b561
MAISRDRYSAVAIVLHWTIAILILSNIGIAWYFNTLHGMAKLTPIALHQSIGLMVLTLSVVRLGWRLAVRPPKLPDYVRGWERWLATTVHVGFYVIMLGLPLTGWAMRSASPLHHVLPINLFGVPWPEIGPLAHLPPDQAKTTEKTFEAAHGLLAKLAYVLIALHVAGALKHQFISNDDVVARMIPLLPRRMNKDAAT